MHNTEQRDTLLNRLEAASLAGVHYRTLDAARGRGEIAFARVGPHRKVLFQPGDILDWTKRRSTPVQSPRKRAEPQRLCAEQPGDVVPR